MKIVLHLTVLFLFTKPLFGQNFLLSYEKYRLNEISSVTPRKAKMKLERFIRSQTIELDTIFKSYKVKTGFDFNKADTLFLIYNWAVESPFISDVIIWSNKDTISYSQGFELVEPGKNRRTIIYTPFISSSGQLAGYKTITERDSLINLVSKREYNTILHLGDNQQILDGGRFNIYVAIRNSGTYKIESCDPPKFTLETIYRKE